MSLAVVFIVIAAFIIIRDRRDWLGYLVIILGALYIGSMPGGEMVTGWLDSFAAWLDQMILNLLKKKS